MKLRTISLLFAMVFAVGCSNVVLADTSSDEDSATEEQGSPKVRKRVGRTRSVTHGAAVVVDTSGKDGDGGQDKKRRFNCAAARGLLARLTGSCRRVRCPKRLTCRRPTRNEAVVAAAVSAALLTGAPQTAWVSLVENYGETAVVGAILNFVDTQLFGNIAYLFALVTDNFVGQAVADWGGRWLLENATDNIAVNWVKGLWS